MNIKELNSGLYQAGYYLCVLPDGWAILPLQGEDGVAFLGQLSDGSLLFVPYAEPSKKLLEIARRNNAQIGEPYHRLCRHADDSTHTGRHSVH